MKKIIPKITRTLKTFPKKHHVEYITALLSIPVLLSVIALNYFNLQNTTHPNFQPTPQPQVIEKPVIIDVTGTNGTNTQPNPTNTPSCKKEVGPISISSPKEGEVVSGNPVCLTIKYDIENYCSVVWSYRINSGQWSDYNSNSPCIYNLPDGNVTFDLRVQSTVSQDTDTLKRSFIYKSATSSATQQ